MQHAKIHLHYPHKTASHQIQRAHTMIYFFALTFLSMMHHTVCAEENKQHAIQELIMASDMMVRMSEELGPFQHFQEDRDQIEKDMRKEGFDEEHIKENLGILSDFHQELQKAKGPMMAKVIHAISEHLDENLTLDDIQELLRFFKSEVLQKFKKISLEKMPEVMAILQKEKMTHLQEPFEKMKEKLSAIKLKNNQITQTDRSEKNQ